VRPIHGALAAIAATLALTLTAPAAAAATAPPLGLGACSPIQGVQQCSGLVATWDGVPLDTAVTLPAGAAPGPLPLVVEIHGFGNSRYEYLDPASTAYTDNAYAWARAGYAVLTYTARGLWGSCGTPESRAANAAACARGYIHLADARYEVRDTQELIGRLVDEGVADAARIGVTGDSYGGGQSMMLAALRDRVMQPDGSLVPWRSPAGKPLAIAAAAPVIPWTDLLYAIAPNGRTVTYAVTPREQDAAPVGVFKTTFANGIAAAAQFAAGPGQPVGEPYVPGRPMGYLAPPGADPEADVLRWVARADAGEPYDDADARAIVERLERFHSAYWIDSSHDPAPLFVASGFTDDLFPVDEAVRFANRMRAEHPRVPVAMTFGDFGHQRASNKAPERARLVAAIHAWMDRHLRGSAAAAPAGVTASTETCPRDAPSQGPFEAPSFDRLARGEVRYGSDSGQTVESTGGDPRVGAALDPVAGGGDACVTTSAAMEPGSATYLLPAATGPGYTLLGSPTIAAKLTVSGQNAQLAARLWDVTPDGGSQTLVARGMLRPDSGSQVWQLHPGAWRFAQGHVPKLELLGNDAPSMRPSNGAFEIRVDALELRLPVREPPDCTVVLPKAAPMVPAGQALAPGVPAAAAPGCGRRTKPAPRLRLGLRCTRAGLRATATTTAAARVRRVDFLAAGRRVASDRRRPFSRVVVPPARARRRVAIAARARLASGRTLRAGRRARTCRARRGARFTG
jgi:hypothetical protein